MSCITIQQPRLTQTSLLDEVIGVLCRGESALFDDLARATWDPRATLADLTGTLRYDSKHTQTRAAA